MRDIEPVKGVTKTTVTLYMLMLSYAVFTTIIGCILLRLIDEFSLQLSQGGVFIAVQNIGCFIGILISGVFIDRYSKSKLIFLSYAGLAVALVAVAFTVSMAAYLILIFLAGLTAKFLDALLNSSISQMYVENKGFYLNILHCSFGIGSLCGPLFAGMIVEKGYAWRSAYWLLGLVCLVLLIAYAWMLRGESNAAAAATRKQAPVTSLKAVLQPRMLILWLMLFFYCGHEIGLNNWLPAYMTETFESDAVTSAAGVSVFWFGLIFSRLACSFLTKWVYEKNLLIVGGVLGSVLLQAGVLGGSEILVLIGSAGAGFFGGATIPMVMTLGYTWYPGAQGKTSMVLFIAITLGAVAFPWLMGIVGGVFGLKAAMVMNGLLLLVVCLLALSLPKRQADGLTECVPPLAQKG